MFPAKGNQNENRYLDILTSALKASGANIISWNKYYSAQKGDIFHVHWPTLVLEIRNRKYQKLRGDIILWNFFNYILYVKSKGGKIVWTVHDLQSHDRPASIDPFEEEFLAKFIDSVDGFLCLTANGLPQILDAFPALKNKPNYVTPHPHYRSVYPQSTYTPAKKKDFGWTEGKKVGSLLGTLRPDKAADVIANVFANLNPKANVALLIRGRASQEMQLKVKNASKGSQNIFSAFEYMTDEELLSLYACTDFLVFPGKDYFNSATIYTSLSLNIPILAYKTPTNKEIQSKVGENWMYLFEGDLNESIITKAIAAFPDRSKSEICDLSAFAPMLCAQATIHAYKSIAQQK